MVIEEFFGIGIHVMENLALFSALAALAGTGAAWASKENRWQLRGRPAADYMWTVVVLSTVVFLVTAPDVICRSNALGASDREICVFVLLFLATGSLMRMLDLDRQLRERTKSLVGGITELDEVRGRFLKGRYDVIDNVDSPE